MRKFFRTLYLPDRFFLIYGSVAFLFFLSFAVRPLFYVALGLLAAATAALAADLFLLYRQARTVRASRRVQGVLSLYDDNAVALTLTNRSALHLRLTLVDETPHQFELRDFRVREKLAPKEKRIVRYTLRPVVRGEYDFGNVNVFVRSRIGLAVKRETTAAGKKVAVFPSVVRMRREELLAMGRLAHLQGEKKAKKIGRSYEFDQIKSYVYGDDPRNINWKATSRLHELMTNHYEDERSQQVYSVIDKGRTMKTPFNGMTLVDYAVNTALALSNIVLKKQDKAGLIIFSRKTDTFVKADRGGRQLRRLLTALYRERYDYSEAGYEALYMTVRRSIPNRSLLFLYTNFTSLYSLERVLPVLRMLNRLHVLLVVFFDDAELEAYSETPARTLLDIYQRTIAQKFILEKGAIIRELNTHGIQAMKCNPDRLSTESINKYLDMKRRGVV